MIVSTNVDDVSGRRLGAVYPADTSVVQPRTATKGLSPITFAALSYLYIALNSSGDTYEPIPTSFAHSKLYR